MNAVVVVPPSLFLLVRPTRHAVINAPKTNTKVGQTKGMTINKNVPLSTKFPGHSYIGEPYIPVAEPFNDTVHWT